MSELNRRLHALSQTKLSSASQAGSPLRAAEIAPIPTASWPKWALLGIGVLALGALSWYGRQPQSAATAVDVATVIPQADTPMPSPPPVTVAVTPSSPALRDDTVTASPMSVRSEVDNTPVIIAQERQSEAAPAEVVSAKQGPDSAHVQTALSTMPVASASLESEAQQQELQSSYDQGYETGYEEALAVVDKTVPPKVVSPSPVSPPKPVVVAKRIAPEKSELSIQTVALSPPELAQVEYTKAERALEQENSPQAITHFKAALRYRPTWVDARQRLAALYYGRGQVRDAVATLEQGLATQPNSPVLRLTLAKLLVNESQSQAALAVLNDTSGRLNTQYLAMRGALAQQLNQTNIALKSYHQLVQLDANNGRWWMGLAIAQDRHQAPKKAIASYRKALLMGNISASSQQFIQQRLTALQPHRS